MFTERLMREDPFAAMDRDLAMLWTCCLLLRGMTFMAPGCPTLFSVWAPIAQRALAAAVPAELSPAVAAVDWGEERPVQ